MTKTRTETDSFGPLEVPSDKYWGAQTQRSIINFPIGWERQPVAIIRALGVIKKACAIVNVAQGDLDAGLGKTITAAADEAKLSRTDADTPFGNALEVLGAGPEGAAERALASGLWAHAVAEARRDDDDRLAGDILWLATHTAFDAMPLLDRALADQRSILRRFQYEVERLVVIS